MKIRKADGTVIEVAENYILADGEALTVPMMMMDSTRSIITDGRGNPAGQRPGFLYADTGADTAHVVRETLYREYANGIEQRWQSERWQKPLNERHLPPQTSGTGDVEAAHAEYRRQISERWR